MASIEEAINLPYSFSAEAWSCGTRRQVTLFAGPLRNFAGHELRVDLYHGKPHIDDSTDPLEFIPITHVSRMFFKWSVL